jgi:sugar phosphate isomerase/epimerase
MFADYEMGRTGASPINIASTDRAQRIDAMDEIKRSIEIAEQIPFRFLIQHIGVANETFDERKIESAMTSVEHLRAFAKPLGVRLLLENIPNELATPDRIVEFLHVSHFDDVGVCFDVGHAHMAGDIPAAFEILKDHIRSTHVHDNAKGRDSHLWPGKGTINWQEAMELLRSAPHKPPLLLEIEDDKAAMGDRMSEAFEILEAA